MVPVGYSPETLLETPAVKKPLLRIQGGGSREQKGGFLPLDTKELIIQCNARNEKLHYVIDGKIEKPLEGVKEIVDANFDGIEKKSMQYSWVLDEDCFNIAAVPLLNTVGDYMKDGGIVAFIDYSEDMLDKIDLIKKFIKDMENKYERLTDNWDISVIRASEFPFILGFTDGDGNARIPEVLMLFTLANTTSADKATIKLDAGFRVRNPDTAKENIKNLSFTQSEGDLFNFLHFDKPFIRKFILRSDASKESFFEFWKMYVTLDGTSQFKLMTALESRKVQGYITNLLDEYRKYLSESALHLLFHDNEIPFTPVEESSINSFIFTKDAPGVEVDYKKISAEVKLLIETISKVKNIRLIGHRTLIAQAEENLVRVKLEYENLIKEIEEITKATRICLDAAKNASIDSVELSKAFDDLQAFKFTESQNTEDYMTAANTVIPLANKVLKSLLDLEEAAKKFAIIVEKNVPESNNNSTYEPSEGSETYENDLDEENDENSNNNSNNNSNTSSEAPRPRNVELNRLKAILNQRKDPEDRLIEVFRYLDQTFPKEKYPYFKSLMGVGRGCHFDIDHGKIEPGSFFELYIENRAEATFPWILNTLIRIKYKKFESDDLKEMFVEFYKSHIFNAPGGVKYKERVMSYIST